jgi:hypothetical protein
MHVSGLLGDICRSTPAALMRSAHPCPEQINGLNYMAGTESRFQDAGSTDFAIMY